MGLLSSCIQLANRLAWKSQEILSLASGFLVLLHVISWLMVSHHAGPLYMVSFITAWRLAFNYDFSKGWKHKLPDLKAGPGTGIVLLGSYSGFKAGRKASQGRGRAYLFRGRMAMCIGVRGLVAPIVGDYLAQTALWLFSIPWFLEIY